MPAAAAALSSSEQQAVRTWWSLSKSPRKDLEKNQQQQPKLSGKFHSFACAIGLKPKKHTPSHEPVSPIVTIQTRPPSKSVSSTQTRVDSLEPRTPVDLHRDKHQSLLTLPDTDPFAGRPVIAVPVPNLPSDSNRLSANSYPPVTDFVQKKPDTFNRVSYASSFSTSHGHAIDILPVVPVSTNLTSDSSRLNNKRFAGSPYVKRAEPLTRQNSFAPSIGSPSNTGSTSTLVDLYRRSQPDPDVTRPRMRARVMTDAGSTQQAGFFVQDCPPPRRLSHTSPPSNISRSSSSNLHTSQDRHISPKVIIRQASLSRVQTPPSAPPTQRLPPPPFQAEDLSVNKLSGAAYQQLEPTSLSSIPFSTTVSSPDGALSSAVYGMQVHEQQPSSRHEPDNLVGRDRKESKSALDSPRTLKKSRSHQTLSRRNDHTPPPATPKIPAEASFRKQRTFAHPRLPIPLIPLSIRPSSTSTPTSFPSLPEFGNQTPTCDSQKGYVASPTGRRRLFSGTSKLSASQPTSNDDDTLSTFSLRSERDPHPAPYKPWIHMTKTKPPSSFWEEVSVPGSPVRSTSEYTPQVIMSREELARLEESVENSPGLSARSRAFSVLSTSTITSDFNNDNEFSPVGLSPPPPSSRPNSKQMRIGASSNSFSPKSPSTLSRPSSPPSIPSIANDHHNGSVQTISSVIGPGGASSSSLQVLVTTSLPPPPRSHRPTLILEPDLLEPAPLHRRSITRKSSFLDISDSDMETESEISERVTGSFLDLARESFDTVRSEA